MEANSSSGSYTAEVVIISAIYIQWSAVKIILIKKLNKKFAYESDTYYTAI